MTDSRMRFRLGRTFSAQIYSQVVTVACQLALVPLLLGVWGANRYGAWLVLTALPTFLTFSDFGFTFVAKNEMVLAVARGNRALALGVFQSIFGLLNIVAPIIGIAIMFAIFAFDPAFHLSIKGVDVGEVRWTLMAFGANVLLYQYFLLICAGIRADNRPATESIWGATARLSENLAYGIGAICTHDLALVAGLGLCSRIVFLVASYCALLRISPWLRLGLSAATRREIARLSHPAFAYMLVPIGQALLIQGPVVILGKFAGPLAVVIFSTSRTLTRLGTAVTNMFNNTFVAEYSAAAGRGDIKSFTKLQRIQLSISSLVIVCYVSGLFVLSSPAMRLFTHGRVNVVQPFFLIMTLSVAAEMLWTAQFTAISAVNRHKIVTYWLAGMSVAGLAIYYLVAGKTGIFAAALTIFLVHSAMIFVCAWASRRQRLIEDTQLSASAWSDA